MKGKKGVQKRILCRMPKESWDELEEGAKERTMQKSVLVIEALNYYLTTEDEEGKKESEKKLGKGVKRDILQFRLTETQKERLKKEAKKLEMSVNDLILKSLRYYFEKAPKKVI